MIDRISVVTLLNEKEACVIFSTDGKSDLSEMLYSKDPHFHEWCLDYFNNCWNESNSFKEDKLVK